jgi:hypothetical protein
MSKGAQLSAAIEARLGQIKPANGFTTDIKAVYPFGKAKPDTAPAPVILLRAGEDQLLSNIWPDAIRQVTYQIEGVMARAATLQELQALHHDIVKAVCGTKLPGTRPLENGHQFEDSADFDPDTDGSTNRRVIVSITLNYVESY